MKQSSSTPVVYQFNSQKVRTQTITSEAWFCLADVCQVLNLKQTSPLQKRLNPKGVIKNHTLTKGGKQELLFVNESNLYKLIFRSNKPEARVFEDWVTGTVLPAIRKTGSYTAKQVPFNPYGTHDDHSYARGMEAVGHIKQWASHALSGLNQDQVLEHCKEAEKSLIRGWTEMDDVLLRLTVVIAQLRRWRN